MKQRLAREREAELKDQMRSLCSVGCLLIDAHDVGPRATSDEAEPESRCRRRCAGHNRGMSSASWAQIANLTKEARWEGCVESADEVIDPGRQGGNGPRKLDGRDVGYDDVRT